MAPRIKSVEERFWSKVDKSGEHWLWIGNTDNFGYGRFSINGNKRERSHRYSYILTYGSISNNLCVLHKCDIPNCVKPNHLFLGTRLSNSIDARSKRRFAIGNNIKSTKLSEQDIKEIRSLIKDGYTLVYIAKRFGVVHSTIHCIKAGITWKHIK